MADVEFIGEKFRLAGEISEFALMEFAEAAEETDTESLAGLAACMRLLKEAVDPKDWARFRSHARKHKASVEQCMPVIVSVFQDATDRPTGRPSDSSDGPEPTGMSSGAGSSSAALRLLDGRPDLQQMVVMAEQARSA